MNFGAFATGLAIAFALLLFGRLPLLLRRAAGDSASFAGGAGAGGPGGAGGAGAEGGGCVRICDSCTPSSQIISEPLPAPMSAPCALIGAPFSARLARGTCGTQFFGR